LSEQERTGANVCRESTSWGSLVRAQYRPLRRALLITGFRRLNGKRHVKARRKVDQLRRSKSGPSGGCELFRGREGGEARSAEPGFHPGARRLDGVAVGIEAP